MTIGFVLLVLTGVLLLFGVGQRVLDRLRLTDRQAILYIALIIAGGLLPDIRVTESFRFNLGGALVPLILCMRLFAKAGSARERARSVAATLITAVAVWLLGRYFPDEPERMPFDPMIAYGLAAGVVAYALGRSRRGAFIAGTLGVMLADVANWLAVRAQGVEQTLSLGGAGAYDAVVIAGLLAVLLSELTGEIIERAARGRRRPTREFVNGDFVRREGK